MRQKGWHVELMKTKGWHVSEMPFASQQRATLLVCISATCHPLRWSGKGWHVEEMVFCSRPSGRRAHLFWHGLKKGGTSLRWDGAESESRSRREAGRGGVNE